MSWVEIKKDKDILKVPYQAFKDLFEKNGFVIANDENPTQPIKEPIEQEEVVEKIVKEKVNDGKRIVSNRTSKK